jgi:DNA replicative helicase MCM subunit Mcm2 (Cdc46/Mcm family)
LSKEVTPNITGENVQKCKKFSKQMGDVIEMLSKFLVYSIHGHEYIGCGEKSSKW